MIIVVMLVFVYLVIDYYYCYYDFLFRETWNKPQKVEGLNQVRALAAFASGVVSAAIGDDGTLWVWGMSKRGQLGLGKDITDAVLPTRVDALLGQEIAKVVLISCLR